MSRLRRGAIHVPHAPHMDGGGREFLREIAAPGARLRDCAARRWRDPPRTKFARCSASPQARANARAADRYLAGIITAAEELCMRVFPIIILLAAAALPILGARPAQA